MPDSDEKRELGGLARSIDALFSQDATVRVAEASGVVSEEAVPAPPAPVIADVPSEPDPFDSLEAYNPDPAPGLSSAEVEARREVALDSQEPEALEVLSEPELAEREFAAPELTAPEFAEPEFAETEFVETGTVAEELPAAEASFELAEVPAAVTSLEPAGAALDDAVEAFLLGTAEAADEVRALAGPLRERLSLDPLADAVERLVHADDGSGEPGALYLATEIINPAVASRLVQRMGHEEDDERRAAYVVLSQRLGIVMANAFRGALTASTDTRVRRAYYDGLIAMSETSRPVIAGMVEDDNRFLVRNAVAMLGEMGGEGALELVTSALANIDARVRCEALESIAKLGGEESAQVVLGALGDPDAKVRAAAAEAAGELRVERSLRPILALLQEEDDPSVLVSLLLGLGRLGDPGAVQAIEKRAVPTLFSKQTTEVRVAAYWALNQIGSPHARELIQRAWEDKDAVVRTTVRGLAPGE